MTAWNGFLWKTDTGIEAELHDVFGYITKIVGVPAVDDQGRRGYAISATTIIPDSLKLPFDDEAP